MNSYKSIYVILFIILCACSPQNNNNLEDSGQKNEGKEEFEGQTFTMRSNAENRLISNIDDFELHLGFLTDVNQWDIVKVKFEEGIMQKNLKKVRK